MGWAEVPCWKGGFLWREVGKKKGEQDLFPLVLGSHPAGFTTFTRRLYIQFCLIFLLQRTAGKGHLLFDKEETQASESLTLL